MKNINSEEYISPSVQVFVIKTSDPIADSPTNPGEGEDWGSEDI